MFEKAASDPKDGRLIGSSRRRRKLGVTKELEFATNDE